MPLHVPTFDGGVVIAGSADTQRTNELLIADSYDIGPRGALIAASDLSDYVTLKDWQNVAQPWTALHGLGRATLNNVPYAVAVGEGKDNAAVLRYLVQHFLRFGAANPPAGDTWNPVVAVSGHGVQVTIEQFPGTFAGLQVALVCIGAREGFYPKTEPGLFYIVYNPGTGITSFQTSQYLNALGIGTQAGGTHSKQLYFRGIVGFNNHMFGYGFDNSDATNGDGPNRLMFCNAGDPTTWGNDNIASSGDRAFTDSDAIVLGDAGEIVRGGLRWGTKLWFGTNRGLHWIGGYGRDSYLTDGANPVANAYNIIGAHAIIEGHDKQLYGVCDQGLWAFDGAGFVPYFKQLVDKQGQSNGYWDLIWTDPTQSDTYPGKTNQDLVWMAKDPDTEQLLIGIPWCNAAAGYGKGTDTVVIKFHVRGGGFTRQVFPGVNYTAAGYFARESRQVATKFFGTATAGVQTIRQYAYRVNAAAVATMPTSLPHVKFGPYAPFGPDGQGVIRRGYLTLSWGDASCLPIVFTIASTIDQNPIDSYALTIAPSAPVAPVAGDCWLDTSQTNTSLGNQTAGVNVPARGGYLLYTWSGSAWRLLAGQGVKGTRATIQLPLTRVQGVRLTIEATCTAAAGRFQIEGLGINPGDGEPDV